MYFLYMYMKMYMYLHSKYCQNRVISQISSAAREWVTSYMFELFHIWMSPVISEQVKSHMNESCHIYGRVMSPIWISYFTYMNEPSQIKKKIFYWLYWVYIGLYRWYMGLFRVYIGDVLSIYISVEYIHIAIRYTQGSINDKEVYADYRWYVRLFRVYISGLFWVYVSLLSIYISLLGIKTALRMTCRALLMIYTAFLRTCRGCFISGLFWVYVSLLSIYLSIGYL